MFHAVYGEATERYIEQMDMIFKDHVIVYIDRLIDVQFREGVLNHQVTKKMVISYMKMLLAHEYRHGCQASRLFKQSAKIASSVLNTLEEFRAYYRRPEEDDAERYAGQITRYELAM